MGRRLLLKILAAITERRLTDRLHAGKLAERKQKKNQAEASSMAEKPLESTDNLGCHTQALHVLDECILVDVIALLSPWVNQHADHARCGMIRIRCQAPRDYRPRRQSDRGAG